MKNVGLLRRRTFLETLALFSVIVVWWAASFGLPQRVLPAPPTVLGMIISNFVSGNAVYQTYATMIRILVGFFGSLGIGLSLGILMGTRRVWENYFGTWVMVGLAFPDILWPILAIVWFGMNEVIAYFSIIMIVFPIVTVNIWEGVKAVDKSLVDMAKVFKINKLRIIRNVYIPSLMPHIMSTMRYAFAISWKIVIIAEMLGLSNGVGYMLRLWYGRFVMGQVLAWAITFIIIMILVERFVFDRIAKRAFKWRPEVKL